MAEILSPEFPGERLLVCFNPRLRQQRARKREDLLRATEATLAKIAAAARKHRPGPENRDRTLQSLGRQAHRHKVEKHFDLTVTDDDLQWSRNREKIKAEARLDGIYVIRTNLDTAAIDTHAGSGGLQEPLAGRTGLSFDEDDPAPRAPGLRLHRTARARA